MVTPWNERPAEVRLMILEMLLADGEPREPRQLSKLATVCKDWQDLFEKENWKRLCLTSACIVDFDRLVVGRRRRYLQNIWIRGHIKDLTSGTPGIPSSVIDLSRMLLSLSTWDESDAPSSLMVVYGAHETMEPFDPRVNVQKHIYSEPGRNEGSDLAFICDVLRLQSAHQNAEWCEKRGLPVITADEESNASIVSRYVSLRAPTLPCSTWAC